VCLDDGKTGAGHDETSVGAGPGGWRSVLPQPIDFEIAVKGRNGYSDGRNRRSSGECRVNWVGPAGYRKWADKAFADHEKVAIKIGMWKKQ